MKPYINFFATAFLFAVFAGCGAPPSGSSGGDASDDGPALDALRDGDSDPCNFTVCDDGNDCTEDTCTASGCRHTPLDHTHSCDKMGTAEGLCSIDRVSIPLGVCCPIGTCLGIVDSSVQCVSECPAGTKCDPVDGFCQ